MPRIETGPTRAIGAIDARIARPAGGQDSKTEKAAAPRSPSASAVVRSEALDAGAPPVDSERVSMIRKAVENGTYPVVPTRIADAMIAAGYLLRSPE